MKILIACEFSGIVRDAFIRKGYNAWSCDILPSESDFSNNHYQCDVFKVIRMTNWDMIIAFPPCTYLTTTGNRWFNIEKYGEKAIKRHEDRKKAIRFFMGIINANCDRIIIENPVGIMSTQFRKPDQIINPYNFGDPFEKKTCLWIKGVRKLEHTNNVQPPPRVEYASGKTMPKWYADAWKLPKKERAKVRSKTFPGIANAMADQWGSDVI